jgi:hypothetical protein
MSNNSVPIWNQNTKFGRAPASGEILVGDGAGFTLTGSNVIWGNPVEFTVPIKVDGQVWSTTTGFKFPDGTVQTSAATSYSPPTISNNTILSNVSGGTAAASANTLTQVLDSTVSSTQGTIVYRGASSWTALAPGTSGQVLTSGGTGANPSWGNGNTWTLITKTADQSTTPSYADDTELYFSGVAGKTYLIRGVYFVTAPTNTWNAAINGPTFSSMQAGPNFTSGQYVAVNQYDLGFVPTLMYNKAATGFNIVVNLTASGTLNMRVAGTSAIALKGSWIEYTSF